MVVTECPLPGRFKQLLTQLKDKPLPAALKDINFTHKKSITMDDGTTPPDWLIPILKGKNKGKEKGSEKKDKKKKKRRASTAAAAQPEKQQKGPRRPGGGARGSKSAGTKG